MKNVKIRDMFYQPVKLLYTHRALSRLEHTDSDAQHLAPIGLKDVYTLLIYVVEAGGQVKRSI